MLQFTLQYVPGGFPVRLTCSLRAGSVLLFQYVPESFCTRAWGLAYRNPGYFVGGDSQCEPRQKSVETSLCWFTVVNWVTYFFF